MFGPLDPFANFLKNWAYQPVTDWSRHFTINLNTRDADLERKVLGDVGSYGQQLSRILDAVDLLVSEKDLGALSPEQRKTVVRLQDLAAQARESVRRNRHSAGQ
jgi:hypothetical protein